MGWFDFLQNKNKYDDIPQERGYTITVQDNSAKGGERPLQAVQNLGDYLRVAYRKYSNRFSNRQVLEKGVFHLHMEHGQRGGDLPDLQLVDYSNGEATFFLNRCFTTHAQAQQAALQVMQTYQIACPNVLYFPDTRVANRYSGDSHNFFYASDRYHYANGIQLHSTQNRLPEVMPFDVSADHRYLHFGDHSGQAVFAESGLRRFVRNFNPDQPMPLPQISEPLFRRPLDMDAVGELVPQELPVTSVTQSNALSKITTAQTRLIDADKPFIVPFDETQKPKIKDLPKRRKPYKHTP